MHDPRAFTGQALSYVLSPRGACHNQSDFFSIELGGTMEEIGLPMTDRLSSAGKAGYVARHQHWRSLCNNLVICFFTVIDPNEVADLVAAATGEERSLEELILAGERAWNLKRLYNLRLGWNPAGEKLPKLLLQPLPDGGQRAPCLIWSSFSPNITPPPAGSAPPAGPRPRRWRVWGWIKYRQKPLTLCDKNLKRIHPEANKVH